jgi:hypothetical protein
MKDSVGSEKVDEQEMKRREKEEGYRDVSSCRAVNCGWRVGGIPLYTSAGGLLEIT